MDEKLYVNTTTECDDIELFFRLNSEFRILVLPHHLTSFFYLLFQNIIDNNATPTSSFPINLYMNWMHHRSQCSLKFEKYCNINRAVAWFSQRLNSTFMRATTVWHFFLWISKHCMHMLPEKTTRYRFLDIIS